MADVDLPGEPDAGAISRSSVTRISCQVDFSLTQ